MRRIELSQSRVALVDNEDFKWLSQYKWHFGKHKSWKTGYALRNMYRGSQRTVSKMHIEIMQRHRRLRHRKEIDHHNGCGLDNRKRNLRIATRGENGANCKMHSDNTSKVTGVSWDSDRHLWKAFIGIKGRCKTLGRFKRKLDAIRCRQQAEIREYGRFRYNKQRVCPLAYTGKCPDCAARLRGVSLS